jgi:hypothetical protein
MKRERGREREREREREKSGKRKFSREFHRAEKVESTERRTVDDPFVFSGSDFEISQVLPSGMDLLLNPAL